MKKLILSVILGLVSASAFSMDWAEYEALCYKNGTEPIYEEYEEFASTDQCYGELEDLSELFTE